MPVPSTARDVHDWAEELNAVGARLGCFFTRSEPRRRANKAPGHGSWDNDRPPVCGAAGRDSGQVRLMVTERSDRATLGRMVRRASWPMAAVNTDEWQGYNGLPAIGRDHATVCHAEREWARDDDGDGRARCIATRWRGCGRG